MAMTINPDLTGIAARYHGYGANVLAIRENSKKPAHAWKRLQTQRQLATEIATLPWQLADRIGVINGISGVRSFDLDGCEGMRGLTAVWRILDAMGLPETYAWVEQSASGRGWHIWFVCDQPLPTGVLTSKPDEPGVYWGTSADGSFDHLELRWERNQTVIASSDGTDRWLNDAPTASFASVSALAVLAAFRAVASVPTPIIPPAPVVESKLHHDERGAKDDVRTRFDMVAFARRTFGGEVQREANGEVRVLGHGGLIIAPEKGVWYRFSGEVGGDCYDLIGLARYGDAWNRHDKAMFAAALREAADETGVPLKATRRERLQVVGSVQDEAAEAEAGEATLWDRLKAQRSDLVAIRRDGVPQPTMLVQPFLVEGKVTCIAGGPEQGKSWLLSWSLLAVARNKRTSVYLDEESGMADAVARLDALGATDDDLGYIIHLDFKAGEMPLDDLASALMESAIRDDVALFGIDSFSKLFAAAGLDENSNSDATKLMRSWITPVSHQLGRTVLLLDHKTKVDDQGRYGRGASAKLADTDVQWNIEATTPFSRTARGRISLDKQKDRTGTLPGAIKIIAGGDGEGGFVVDVEYTADQPAVRVKKGEHLFLAALYGKDNTPKSWSEWKDAFGGNENTFKGARRRLLDSGMVIEMGGRYWVAQPTVEAYGLGVSGVSEGCDTPDTPDQNDRGVEGVSRGVLPVRGDTPTPLTPLDGDTPRHETGDDDTGGVSDEQEGWPDGKVPF